jgi:DNA (cytosine-5)-methyltransferase 1
VVGFNKGEWSELYVFLYLLFHSNLTIVDDKLNIINQNLFRVSEIIVADKRYRVDHQRVIKIAKNALSQEYNLSTIDNNRTILFEKVTSRTKSRGSFAIPEVMPLIYDLLDGKKFKGSARVKGDLVANVVDNRLNQEVLLKYNIKSNLGRPATLLNASSHTNFIYEVTNINETIMQQNNAIEGRKKIASKVSVFNRPWCKD